MAVTYKAHTTLTALQATALASSDVLADANYATAIETLIDDVSERVDEYLGYQVIVNNYRHDIKAEDWKYDRMLDSLVSFIQRSFDKEDLTILEKVVGSSLEVNIQKMIY